MASVSPPEVRDLPNSGGQEREPLRPIILRLFNRLWALVLKYPNFSPGMSRPMATDAIGKKMIAGTTDPNEPNTFKIRLAKNPNG